VKKNFQLANKKAFSLIEIAIVVLIIGVLIVGVIGGTGLIRSATLSSARSFTVKSVVPQITGLVAWYETSLKESLKAAEASDGNQISAWYDVSPAALALQRYDITPGSATGQRNVLSRTASSAVTYQDLAINDVPAIYFNGSGNLSLSAFYQGDLAQSTIFLVIRPTSVGTTLFDSYSSGSSASIGISSSTVNLNAGSSVSTGTSSNAAAFNIGNDYIIAAYLNGSSSKAYVNDAATSAGNANIDAGSNSITGLTIGSNKSSSSAFVGLISEVIIYDHPLQIQERRDVFKYLSYKYKISVTGI
jgi:prepilin-type N-terminal cleavage/methylation domain-containing protein